MHFVFKILVAKREESTLKEHGTEDTVSEEIKKCANENANNYNEILVFVWFLVSS